MSQLSQQNQGHFDTQSQYPPQDGPTVSLTQDQYTTSNSSPVVEPRNRSLRKAAPSPLQTSTTPQSQSNNTPTRATFVRGPAEDHTLPSTKITQSTQGEPRSPTQRLDELLASEKSFYVLGDSQGPLQKENDSRHGRPLQDTNGALRSCSDPVSSSGTTLRSPTTTRPAMATTAPPHRAEIGRQAPRTSSIDSGISSVSSGGHSHKASHDSKNTTGPVDIAHLIHTTGSPDAAIQYLLKEKQSQAAQNAQLWRLVDKQRAMILGLNKDLERAVKDRERYRKKLKESIAQLSHPSPAESSKEHASDPGSATSEARPADIPAKQDGVEAIISAGLREDSHAPESPTDVALAPYPITPPGMQEPEGLSNMVEAEHKMPSPTKHAFQHYDPDSPSHNGFEAAQQERKKREEASDMPWNATKPPSTPIPRGLPLEAPPGPPPLLPPPPMPNSVQSPTSPITESSPVSPRGAPKSPPLRKAPPAPLNLGKKIETSAHLHEAIKGKEESESDYDDILEVDEIPSITDRGRRKTREEDDRVREIAAAKDAEQRSLSKKSSKSSIKSPKSSSTTPKGAPAMPLSPRQAVPISPPDAHLRHLSPTELNAGSLAGILSASRSPPAKGGVMSPVMSPPLMSPGLPTSPRPMPHRQDSSISQISLTSPPLSPRGMGAFPGAVPLSPRAPRQPIPLPPGTPMSLGSPAQKSESLVLVSPKPLAIAKIGQDNASAELKRATDSPTPSHYSNLIYKGLVTDEYPDLLLPPNALPSIDVKVASSRLKPSRASLMFPASIDCDPVFTLAIFARSDGKELWRVEKDSASLANLDQILKQSPKFTAKTPDRSLFSGHAPAKVDARRAALDQYLDEVLNTELDTASALEICHYLSTNTMEPNADEMNITPSSDGGSESPTKTGPGGRPLKNGYLTKRGKNFGGWKARFFVLDGPVFKYYESPGGPHLGTIKLQKAQIGKQQQHTENQSPSRGETDDADNQYRHAFLILEPKKKDSSSLVRHVLCAESDKERDDWVEALMRYVDYKSEEEEEQKKSTHEKSEKSSHARNGSGEKRRKNSPQGKSVDHSSDLKSVNYESTKPGKSPNRSRNDSGTPSPPTHGHERDPMSLTQSQSSKSISGPRNAQVIQDVGSWGNKSAGLMVPDDKVKQKKRSFFGFGSRPRPSTESQEQLLTPNDPNCNLSQMMTDQHGMIRPVFGAPLVEAVRYNHPANVNIELPAVIYRCIEYLEAKNAVAEEGIFRLSGSNVVIRQLRERFNIEGDVNLIVDEVYYDIHAVASLLKLYLRELPSTILTRELHLEFLGVTELHDVKEKVRALNLLVHRLPKANNTLLRYLAGFLINIINHADVNKMTVRNVGIVFSPTLNIPAPVFALFLQQYDGIFGEEPAEQRSSPIEVTVSAPALTADDIRSPRRQKFAQDLPTPSYLQQQHGFAGFSTMAGPEYGSRAPTLAGPAYDNFPSPMPPRNNKGRESSMFGMSMGLGQKKQTSGGRAGLVEDESFFE